MKTILIIVLLFCTVFAFAEEEFHPFPRNRGTIYEYDEPPDICFFPIDEAHWNGYEITNQNWNQLTDFQKVMFISEAVEEIERNEQTEIEEIDGWRFLIALNEGVAYLEKEKSDAEGSMFELLYEALKSNGFLDSSD